MPKTDDWFGLRFGRRLRSELDRVQPLDSGPRYAARRPTIGVWRIAPLGLAAALVGILAMTAWAATGSVNPTVWTQRVETVINPPSPSPGSEPNPAQPQQPEAAAPRAPEQSAKPEPAPRPTDGEGGRETPRPTGSPEPDDHSGSSWSGSRTSPRTSPSPYDH